MKKQLALALALAAAPFAAFAGGHSYTYIEAGFARLDQELPAPPDLEIDDIEAGGFYVAGSAEVAPSIHVFGAYRKGDDDVGISLPMGGGKSRAQASTCRRACSARVGTTICASAPTWSPN